MALLAVQFAEGRIHFTWKSYNSDEWNAILESVKSSFVGNHERRYDPESKTWSVPEWCLSKFCSWADRWFAPQAQRWKNEAGEDIPIPNASYSSAGGKSSDGRNEQRHRQEQQSNAGQRAGPLETALRQLHLYPSAPWELVQAAHRVLVKLHHPDLGGDTASCAAINKAWEDIQRHHPQRRSA